LERLVELERERMEKKIELLSSYAQWLRVEGRSEASVRDHLWKLSRFWGFLSERGMMEGERVNLLEVDGDMLAAYQASLFEVVSEKSGKKLTCNTQINLLAYLITFFRFLEKSGRIGNNPTDLIKLPRHPHLLPAVILTPEEVRKLLSVPDVRTVMGFRDRTMLELLWSSAPRLGELLSLGVEDTNLREGMVTIREGKGGKERVVPLGKSACAWVAEYRKSVRPLLMKQELPILFLSRSGGSMEKGGWPSKLNVYLHRARIKKHFGTHGFRHMLATEMLRHGADLRHIQQMLGHEDLSTTERYLQVVKAELRRVHHRTHPKERLGMMPVAYNGNWGEES
jgi:integrase/recombinase XerD